MNGFARRCARIFLLFSSLLVAGGLFAVNFDQAAAASLQQHQGQTILVQFAEGTDAAVRDALIADMGGELVTWLHQIHVAEIRLPAQTGTTIDALPQLHSEIVTHFEANLAVQATSAPTDAPTYVPNDPDFSDETMVYGLLQVQALDAWEIVTGSQQIVIAVIDSGIKLDHPEFEGRLVPGYDFVNKDAIADDESGHGTHVAGIIGAALNNGQGAAGVCPNCALMPIKVVGAHGLGSWSQLAQGILFAVDNGARILNISVAAETRSETLAAAVNYALDTGALVVAAAGNFGTDKPSYPASLDGVIAVGATDRKGERWAKSTYGGYIDLVAPGDLIYSTYHDLNNIFHGYTFMSGTSMAAPFVSGVAGLLLSVAPTLSAEDVAAALIWGVDDLGVEGRDADFGYGRVNVIGAFRAPIPGLVKAMGEINEPRQQLVMFLPALNKN